jgi:putative AlgH/UPF0301 family transcriptional regulator
VLRDVEELRDRPDPVYLGGPVAGNLLLVLIRAARQPESSEAIFEGVYVSGSRAALRKALSKAGKRNRVRGYAGHAGWGPGQLDREIARGDWHVTAAGAAMVSTHGVGNMARADPTVLQAMDAPRSAHAPMV